MRERPVSSRSPKEQASPPISQVRVPHRQVTLESEAQASAVGESVQFARNSQAQKQRGVPSPIAGNVLDFRSLRD